MGACFDSVVRWFGSVRQGWFALVRLGLQVGPVQFGSARYRSGVRPGSQKGRLAICEADATLPDSTRSCTDIKLVRYPTPQARKLDQPGKNPAQNTSHSAPVVEKLMSSIGFYPQGVRIIGVLALGPHLAILIFHRQMVPR